MSGKSRREAFWLEHIRTADQSGQSIVAYAKSAKLDVQQLYNWRRRLRAEGKLSLAAAPVPFARVIRAETVTPRDHVALVVSVGHLRMHFDRLPEVAWLAQAVRALEAAP